MQDWFAAKRERCVLKCEQTLLRQGEEFQSDGQTRAGKAEWPAGQWSLKPGRKMVKDRMEGSTERNFDYTVLRCDKANQGRNLYKLKLRTDPQGREPGAPILYKLFYQLPHGLGWRPSQSHSSYKNAFLVPLRAIQTLRHIQRENLVPSGHRSESGKRFSSSRANLVCKASWNWAGSCRRPHLGVEEDRGE